MKRLMNRAGWIVAGVHMPASSLSARAALVLVIAAMFVWAGLNAPRSAFGSATFTVDSTGDGGDSSLDGTCDDGSGSCTLRAAIEEANYSTGTTDTINFSIAGGGSIQTISPASMLPLVTDPVVIDGTTQGGPAYAPIELDGSGCGGCIAGLPIAAGSSTVKGLTINGFAGAGIALVYGGGNTVTHNYIGTNTSATAADGNGAAGVFIGASSDNIVGPENRIDGNAGAGVLIAEFTTGPFGSGDATGNVVSGNSIGIDTTGYTAIANGGAGVEIDGTGTHAVTGNSVGEAGIGGNIAGNAGAGVYIHGSMASNNLVDGDVIGFVCHGDCYSTGAPIPNGSHGVYISDGAHNNAVRSTIIAHNHGAGVAIAGSGTGNNVTGSPIYENDSLGIDTEPLGSVTLPYDERLTAVLYCPGCFGFSGGLMAIAGYVRNGPPNTTFGLESWRNPSEIGCDPSGYGEGARPYQLPAVFYPAPGGPTTDANGNFSAVAGLTGQGSGIVGQYIVAKLSSPDGTTQEYSNCVEAKMDSDSDGIQDEIDPDPSTFSDTATDVPLGGGGTSFGTIVDRAGCYVSIYDLPNPDGGVISTVCPSGGGPASVLVCGIATITMQAGGSISGRCGSLHTQVDIGTVTENFGTFIATVGTKTKSVITDLGGGKYQVDNDAGSASAIVAGGHSVAPGGTITLDPAVEDSDGDGCTNATEIGSDQHLGGQRNPNSFWDYFDTPDSSNVRDRKIRVDDVVRTVNRYNTDDANGTAAVNRNSDPHSLPPATGYHPAFDRTNVGPNPWNLGPPNGKIRVDDVVAVVNQYRNDCV